MPHGELGKHPDSFLVSCLRTLPLWGPLGAHPDTRKAHFRLRCILGGMPKKPAGPRASRRRFIGGLAAAGAVRAQSPGKVSGFDHVALPMENTEGMMAFYRSLGFEVAENATACSVHIGDNMINFHRPQRWRD